MVLLLCSSCTHSKKNPKVIEVDSLVVYSPVDMSRMWDLMHCYILKDSTLKVQTKHTKDIVKEITNREEKDAFITYMKMFYTEQAVDKGEHRILSEENEFVLENYYDIRVLIVRGYKKNRLVLDDTTFVDHSYFHRDYYKLLNLIETLSNKYERSKDEVVEDQSSLENLNRYDQHGEKTGRWVMKFEHSIVISNYISGKLDGIVKRYSLTGELELIRHYKMGVLCKAYSVRPCIYKNIKKSDVKNLYYENRFPAIPVHYIADQISYEGYSWMKSKVYLYDREDDILTKAYCDSIIYNKDPYNATIDSYTTIPNSVNIVRR